MNNTVDLYKVSNVNWVVGRSDIKDGCSFDSIEAACEFLENIGISGDELDVGIISMVANAHTRANFNIDTGKFVFSDKSRPNEITGVA